jgi:nitrate/nitrite-specific signal transduction histidine kinase
MQLQLEVPATLAQQLQDYLQSHPEESVLSLIQVALDLKRSSKDPSKLLQLAGIVTEAPYNAIDHAEDRTIDLI